MKVAFDRSFSKSIDKISSPVIKKKIEAIIIQIESANSLADIHNLKKLEGYKSYFRIRLGEYRLGMELINGDTLLLVVIAHRKDIYKVFP